MACLYLVACWHGLPSRTRLNTDSGWRRVSFLAKAIIVAIAAVLIAGWIYSAVQWRDDCEMILPGLPGTYCLGLDDEGHRIYFNKHYKIYIK